jgi:hypothetical protein
MVNSDCVSFSPMSICDYHAGVSVLVCGVGSMVCGVGSTGETKGQLQATLGTRGGSRCLSIQKLSALATAPLY